MVDLEREPHTDWFVELLRRIHEVWQTEPRFPGACLITDKESWRRARDEMVERYSLPAKFTWHYPMLYSGTQLRWSPDVAPGDVRWERVGEFPKEEERYADV